MTRKKNKLLERRLNEQRAREMSGPRPQEGRPGSLEPQAMPAPQESGDGYQDARLQPQETLSGQNLAPRVDRKIWFSDENKMERLENKIADEFDGEFFRCDYCSVGNSIREEVNEHLVTKKHYSASKYESFVVDKSDKKIKLVEKMSIINGDAKKSVLIVCHIKKCRAISSNIFEGTEHFMSQHYIPHSSILKKCYMTRNVILEKECTIDWNSFEDECIVCQQRFSDKREMHQHYSKTSHYLSKFDISPTFLKDQEEMFTCPFCSDSRCFETLIHLINHQKCHEDKAEGVNKFTLFQTEQMRFFKLSENGISLYSKAKNMKRKREDFDCECAAIEHSKKSRTSEMEVGSMEICDEKDDNKQFETLPRIGHLEESKLAEQFEGEFFRCDYCSIDNSSKENISHHLADKKHFSASMFESVVDEAESGKKKIMLKAKMSVINESAKNSIITLCPDLYCHNKFYSNIFDCTDHIVENHSQECSNSNCKRYVTQDTSNQQDCVIDLRINKCIKKKKCGIKFGNRKNLVKHYMKTNHFMKNYMKKNGITTKLICDYCAVLEKDSMYRTFHPNMRSLVEHHEQTHDSDFLMFKVFQCGNKKWLTQTANGISLFPIQQRNKSKCATATFNINESVSNITAKEEKVSDVEDSEEIVPNVEIKE